MQVVPYSRTYQTHFVNRKSHVCSILKHCSAKRHCQPTQTVRQGTAASATRKAVSTSIDDYDAGSIQVLEGLEPVRKRPGMYIGSTGQRGLHHLVFEVLDNSIDEVQAGHATRVDVDMDLEDGWVTVTDDGRGIPTDIHPRTGKSALETVLTVLHAGGKFGGDASGYKVSGGLHGVGVSVVNALSDRFEVKVWRNGREFFQAFSRGAPLGPMTDTPLPKVHARRQGTQVRYHYDPTVFAPSAVYDPHIITDRLRELAFLNPAATLLFRAHTDKGGAAAAAAATSNAASGDARGHIDTMQFVCKWKLGDAVPGATPPPDAASSDAAEGVAVAGAEAAGQAGSSSKNSGKGKKGKGKGSKKGGAEAGSHAQSLDGVDVGDGWSVYAYRGGLSEFVGWMNKDKTAMHDVISFGREVDGVHVEAALQWCSDAFSDNLVGFANSIRTIDGGTHLDGLKAALTRTVNTLAKKQKLVKEGEVALSGDHIREGLGAAVSVMVPNPEFEGQTKTRLGNPEVRRMVEQAVAACVGEWLEAHPAALGAVVAKAVTAARAAEAAKKARDLVRRKNVLTRTTLPGKLSDCTSNIRSETEIFVVEGDSAGGSAKQARDRHTQAVLPLRGKILNVERKDDAAMLKNQEISNLIVALGLGAKDEGLEGLRYGRVVLLTDADVDGAHIRTLLLTFLFRYRPELFEKGHVYVAVPPLYKLEQSRGKVTWCFSDLELKQATAGLNSGSYTVQRFKGLGEMMPDQLWETTLSPATRILRRLTVEDAGAASQMLSLLMGNMVAPRRELIESHASRFTLEDLDI